MRQLNEAKSHTDANVETSEGLLEATIEHAAVATEKAAIATEKAAVATEKAAIATEMATFASAEADRATSDADVQIARIQTEGDEQEARVTLEGDEQEARLIGLKDETYEYMKRAEEASATAGVNPNLLINGDFSVWQRGKDFYGGDRYTADRWVTALDTSNIYIESLEAGTVPGCLSGMHLGSRSVIRQYVEGHAYENHTVTFSVYACATVPNTKIQLKMPGAYTSYTFDEANVWQRIQVTGVVLPEPSIRKGGIRFDISSETTYGPDGQPIPGGELKITGAKVELGSVATPFIPDDPATNLMKCQRYYRKISGFQMMFPVFSDPTNLYRRLNVVLSPPMRTKPTVSWGATTTTATQVYDITSDCFYIQGKSSNATTSSSIKDLVCDAEL